MPVLVQPATIMVLLPSLTLTGEHVLENDNIVTISMLSMDQNGCALRLKIKIDVSCFSKGFSKGSHLAMAQYTNTNWPSTL